MDFYTFTVLVVLAAVAAMTIRALWWWIGTGDPVDAAITVVTLLIFIVMAAAWLPHCFWEGFSDGLLPVQCWSEVR